MSDDTVKKNISKNIGRYRESIGMSQKELANRLGVVPSRISNWETGANCPTIDILFQVCEILGVSINDIYGVYPDSKFILRYDEQEILKKYRELDAHGKEMVDFTLHKEWERSVSIGKVVPYFPVTQAAHNDHQNEDGEQERMQEDLSNLKRPE